MFQEGLGFLKKTAQDVKTMGKQAKGAAKDVMKEVMSHTEEAMSPDAKAMLEKLKGEYQVRMEKAEEDFLKDLQVKMESSKAALQAKAAEMEKEFNEKKDQLKHDLKLKMDQELSEQLDKRMLPLLQESLLSDEMPAWVHEEVNDTVVAVWPDVKQELWSVYQDSVLKYEPIPAGEVVSCCPSPWRKFRAFVLYTLFPYDRSLWYCLKNPVFWVINLIMICPFYAIQPAMFLLELILRDTSDEAQLVEFIVLFKAFQFFTVGIITGAVGAITYFDCVNFDSEEVVEGSDVWLHECNKSGPAAYTAFYIDIIGFFFCSLLILTAFFMLPYSRKKGQRTLAADSPPRSFPSGMDPEVHTEGCGCLCGVKMYTNRGGALRHLLVWDVCCFVLVVAITAACVLVLRPYNLLSGGDFERFEWQFKADLFFVRALYGVLSLPFLLFVIPPFSTLFLHVIPTGYNKAGECVPMMTGKDLSEVTRQRRLRQQIANTSNRVHPVDEGDGEGREEGKEGNEATAMQALVKAEEGKGNRKTAWSGE